MYSLIAHNFVSITSVVTLWMACVAKAGSCKKGTMQREAPLFWVWMTFTICIWHIIHMLFVHIRIFNNSIINGTESFSYFRLVSTIFECEMVSTDSPLYMSLVDETCTRPTPALCVNNASLPVTYERQFTVCLSPLHNDVNPLEPVEWIELNRILGVQNNHSASRIVDRILAYYASHSLIEIIQWQLPFTVKDISITRAKQPRWMIDCSEIKSIRLSS